MIFRNGIIGIILLIVLFCISCENKIEEVQNISKKHKNEPIQITKNAEIIISDSGCPVIKIITPLIKTYIGITNYTEFPNHVKVIFYDSLYRIKSYMEANYGIIKNDENRVEARNNVIVVNEKGEKLNTEHLVWDQKKEIIMSDVFVKITTKDEIMYGDGLEADQYFDKWEIKKPRGVMSIKK